MPPRSIIRDFLGVRDAAKGPIAWPNTGWTARETIGWLRLVRPGSVTGEQQHFLVSVEHELTKNRGAPGLMTGIDRVAGAGPGAGGRSAPLRSHLPSRVGCGPTPHRATDKPRPGKNRESGHVCRW